MGVAHEPVMLSEVLEAMKIRDSGVYIDGTIGLGGHAEGILKKSEGKCTVIGIDRDSEALKISEDRLKGYDVHLVKDEFSNINNIAGRLGYEEVDGVLLDLGVSTLQLKEEGRGFSFLKDEPLDMRMDKSQQMTAATIVNEYSEADLANAIWKYGDEWKSRRIAKAIVYAREKTGGIKTCRELAGIIEKAVRRRGRIHPATKTFQALRIELNKELTLLSMAMKAGVEVLGQEGRFCVMSYHSLEDRIVKHSFKDMAKAGLVRIITKKPIVPTPEEQRANPSSRSAKLRVAEKI